MGRWLRLVVAVSAVVLALVSAGAEHATADPVGHGPMAGRARAVATTSGASCLLDVSRCTPASPPGPAGLPALAGAAFLGGGGMRLKPTPRWRRGRRSAGRLAAGVRALVVRPPRMRPLFL
jgi:hypothetical protein